MRQHDSKGECDRLSADRALFKLFLDRPRATNLSLLNCLDSYQEALKRSLQVEKCYVEEKCLPSHS
jgi:hypothetical protein